MNDKEKRDLAVVLTGQSRTLEDAGSRADALLDDEEMNALRAEARALLGAEALEPEGDIPPLEYASPPPPRSWEELIHRNAGVLREHGLDGSTVSIDSLLTPEMKLAIDQEWAIWPKREPWRWPWDFIAVGAAGLAGGLVDLAGAGLNQWVQGNVGKDMHDEVLKRGDATFKALHGRDVKRPMSGHVLDSRVPKDLMMDRAPEFHRAFGPTHDLCRIREALALMMGSQADFEVAGSSVAERLGGSLLKMGSKGEAAKVFREFATPGQALTATLFHWLADFFSTRGLPIPGTSHLVDLADKGKPGRRVAEFAVQLYERGFTLRELFMGLNRLSGVTLTTLMLRASITLQRWTDGERSLRQLVDWSSRNRYIEMFLVAHGIAAGVGATTAAITWNPAFLNGGAILAASKNAAHLAWRVYREKQQALAKFADLAAENSASFDEMLVRNTAGPVAALVPVTGMRP